MESLSSENKSIALDILKTSFLPLKIENEISPLKGAIRFFINNLSK